MVTIKSVRVLDNEEAFQKFPIEITYVEDGREIVRLTSAGEVIDLFKAVQQTRSLDAKPDNSLSDLLTKNIIEFRNALRQ